MTLWLRKPAICLLCVLFLTIGFKARAAATGIAEITSTSTSSTIKSPDRLAGWQAILQSIEKALLREGITDEELTKQSAEAMAIRLDAFELEKKIAPQVLQVRKHLDELGPAPKKDDPAESDDIAGNRKQLEEQYTLLDGRIKAARLIILRASQIEKQIIDNRRARFVTQILQHSNSIFDIRLWQSFWNGLDGFWKRFALLISDSVSVIKSGIDKSGILTTLLLSIILFIILSFVSLRRTLARKRDQIIQHNSDDMMNRDDRIRLAGFLFARNGLIPIGCIFSLYFVLSFFGILAARLEVFAFDLTVTMAGLIFSPCLARIYLSPGNSTLRIAALPDPAAKKINRTILSGTLFIAIIWLVNKTAALLATPVEVSIGFSVLLSFVCFVSVFIILVSIASNLNIDQSSVPARTSIVRWGRLNPLFWLSGIGGVFCLVAGYIALAEFLTWQILLGAALFSLLWLCIELLGVSRETYLDGEDERWLDLSRRTGLSRQVILQLSVFGFGLLKLLAIIVTAIIFMISWGYSTGDWAGPISEAFFGFEIGGLTISFSSIALTLLLFFVGYVITRTVQHWLRYQFLPTTTLDPGLRNSIATVFGYVGIVFATLLAITSAGLDLSKVAIVAGALSVGIGFGLQSIVNNFVSGLILLAERPIKSGDWIIASNAEGRVRKTSVRSTEVETFDGATVIIPNSTLITDTVTNWTHDNKRGRVIIAIGVGYNSDVDQVRSILLECGQSHDKIVENPPPRVYFMDFGADALIFELRAYLSDINNSLTVRSDLRFSIIRALREANVEIPYPQRDVHIKSIPADIPTEKSILPS